MTGQKYSVFYPGHNKIQNVQLRFKDSKRQMYETLSMDTFCYATLIQLDDNSHTYCIEMVMVFGNQIESVFPLKGSSTE